MPEIQKAICVDRGLYLRLVPGSSFEEARSTVLANYVDNTLDGDSLTLIKKHLERCRCCSRFAGELTAFEMGGLASNLIPVVVCPSSQTLDFYIHTPAKLSGAERTKVEKHLQDCPFCREEEAWARGLDQTAPESQPLPLRQGWMQYGWIAATIAFLVFSTVLIRQTQQSLPTAAENQLRALAVVKSPEQIDFDSLNQTSPALSDEVRSRYDKAVAAFQKHDFRHAAAGFEDVMQTVPDHSASLYLLGYSYYMMNEPQKAYSLCDKAETMRPHSYERCMSLVHIALMTGHYGRAVREITSLYHEAPQHPEIRNMYVRIMSIAKGRQLTM